MSRPFEVRDIRNKGFFVVDDIYLNGFAKFLGPIGSAVYFSLCRHADKAQSAFPSQEMIATEYNMNKRTVVRYLKLLIKMNLIKMERVRGQGGRWERNTYYLIDKAHWIKPDDLESHGAPSDFNDIHQVTQSHTKDTHTKDTHTLPPIVPQTISLKDEDLAEIATKYHVPIAFVRSKLDDMVLWAGSRPGNSKLRGRNWKLTLMRWVKTDALKIAAQAKKGGMIHVEGQTN